MNRAKRFTASIIVLAAAYLGAQTPTPIPVTGNLTSIIGTGQAYAGVSIQLQNCPSPISISGYSAIVQTGYQIQANPSGAVNSTVWSNDLITCNGTTGNSMYNLSYVANGAVQGTPQCYQVVSTQTWNLNLQQPIACTGSAPNPFAFGCANGNNIASGCTGATTQQGAAINIVGSQNLICSGGAGDQFMLQSAATGARLGTLPSVINLSYAPGASQCLVSTSPGLVLGSGTTLNGPAGNATIYIPLSTGPNARGIVNYSSTVAQRTSAGVSMSSSTTLTLTDSSGTAADVGRWVEIPNGLASGQALWTTVAAVVNANQETLSDAALTSTGSVTATYYNTDSNITISNITVNSQSASTSPTAIAYNTYFRFTDGLKLQNDNFISAIGDNPFAISLGASKNFVTTNIYCLGTSADCVHIEGATSHFLVDHTVCAYCLSDIVGVTGVGYTEDADVWGNVIDGTIQNTENTNTTAGNGNGGILLEGGANVYLKNIRVLNTHDNTSGLTTYAIGVQKGNPSSQEFPGDTVIRGLVIDGVYSRKAVTLNPQSSDGIIVKNIIPLDGAAVAACAVSVGAGTAYNTQASSVDVENVFIGKNATGWSSAVCTGVGGGGSPPSLSVGTLSLRDLDNESAGTGSSNIATIGSNVPGTTTIGLLETEGNKINRYVTGTNSPAYYIQGWTSCPSACSPTTVITSANFSGDMINASTSGATGDAMNIAGYATISKLQWTAPSFNCTSTSNDILVHSAANSTLTHYTITSPAVSLCAALVYFDSGAGASTGEIIGGRPTSGYLGQWHNAQTEGVTISGMKLNGLASAAVYVQNATLTIDGAGLDPNGTWQGLTRAASETVYSTNQSFRADANQLTNIPNALAWNTNIAAGPVGPVIGNGIVWSSQNNSIIFTTSDLLGGLGNFETGSSTLGTGWTGFCASITLNCTFLRDNSWSAAGSYSQKITINTNTGTNTGVAVQSTAKQFTVTNGVTYTVSGSAKNDNGALNSIQLSLISGVTSLCSFGTGISLTSTPINFSAQCLATGSGTAFLNVVVAPTTGGNTGSVWVDNLILTAPGALTPGAQVVATGPYNIGSAAGGNVAYSVSGGTASVSSLTVNTLANPSGSATGTPSTTGGTIAASSYNYAQIVAVDSAGNVSLPNTIANASGPTTGTTSSIAWTWTAVPAAKSYQVWTCNTSSCTPGYYFTSSTNNFPQTVPYNGLGSTSGTLPVKNTTGPSTFAGPINNITVTPPATGATLTIADNTTLSNTNTMNVAKQAGVAGGIPWYDSTTSLSSSGVLTQYGVVYGGGASAAPAAVAACGTGLPIVGSATVPVCATTKIPTAVNSGASVPQVIASGTVALATSSIASGACQAVSAGTTNSAAATSVATTDVIAWTPAVSLQGVTGYQVSTNGALSIDSYPTAGFVNFNVCNWTANPVVPGALTLNWRVQR